MAMKILIPAAAVLASALALASFAPGCAARAISKIAGSKDKSQEKLTPEESLRRANAEFYGAINANLGGNSQPMELVWEHSERVSNSGPFGGRQVGWKAVEAQFKKEAAMKMGGSLACEDVEVGVGADMAYVSCTEVAGAMNVDGKVIPFKVRATNVFRMDKGDWKLVHHHTDPSAPMEGSVKKAG